MWGQGRCHLEVAEGKGPPSGEGDRARAYMSGQCACAARREALSQGALKGSPGLGLHSLWVYLTYG